MKQLLSNTVKEMFGLEREFSDFELVAFYILVIVTTALAIYWL